MLESWLPKRDDGERRITLARNCQTFSRPLGTHLAVKARLLDVVVVVVAELGVIGAAAWAGLPSFWPGQLLALALLVLSVIIIGCLFLHLLPVTFLVCTTRAATARFWRGLVVFLLLRVAWRLVL